MFPQYYMHDDVCNSFKYSTTHQCVLPVTKGLTWGKLE